MNTVSPDESAFVSPQQTLLSPHKDYVVHAVSVFDKVVFVQIVDDKDTPVFLPRALFEMVEADLPDDWICSLFPEGPVQLLLGPPFVARDLDAYNAMLDQEAAQVQRFWQRIAVVSARDRGKAG
jgi:hypothetical protein